MYKANLLSLNKTLVCNWRVGNLHMSRVENWIQEQEEYNSWLISWLRKVDSKVYLFTVRDEKYQEETLDAIAKATSWEPDGAYFKDTHYPGSEGGKVKSILLDRLMCETGLKTSELYAFESNQSALSMWKRRSVPYRKVTEASHLPSI